MRIPVTSPDQIAHPGFDAPEVIAPDVVPGVPPLPFTPIHCPPYRAIEHTGEADDWRFSRFWLPVCPGYFGGPRPLTHPCFALSRGGTSWMSLTPMEVESMLPGIEAAAGKVVVGGMGLALAAFAIAAKPAVERVTVVERDPRVVEMASAFAAIDGWACRDKLEIVTRDLTDHRDPDCDFLFVDIWPHYRMDAMRPQMQAFHAAIPAPRCFYWGQELDAVDHAITRGTPREAFGAADFDAFRDETGLPLVGAEHAVYPELCRLAAANPAIGAKRIPA